MPFVLAVNVRTRLMLAAEAVDFFNLVSSLRQPQGFHRGEAGVGLAGDTGPANAVWTPSTW